MEKLLLPEERACSDCGGIFTFRLSRFGCLYNCLCQNKFLEFSKMVSKYVFSLEHGFNSLSFVPFISIESGFGTEMLKVVQIELNFFTDCLLLSFRNFTVEEKEEVLSMLSAVFQKYIPSKSIPLCMLDLFLAELESVSNSCQFQFFISPPSKTLLEGMIKNVSQKEKNDTRDVLPVSLLRILRAHQISGIEKVLQMNCRAVIADEMGVGKTLEAIGVVAAIQGYPLLLVVPSALKLMWAEEIEKYLFEQVSLDEIHIIKGSNDALSDTTVGVKIVIISFHMVSILQDMLSIRYWKCVVCDEAHFLHTNINGHDAVYTTVVCHLAKKADYCLFLTGTPVTSSPFEMYNILDAISPHFFGESRWDYALRFCRLHFNPHMRVLECARKIELSSLLHQRFMIRRHKEEILHLPEKRRTVLRVFDPQAIYQNYSLLAFQSIYANAWSHKWDGIISAISFCLSKFSRVVCFAHHCLLLDKLETYLARKGFSSIRIDGSVDPNYRHSLLQRFATGEARVAVMGITACGVGISLASAECAIFCELPPDAAWMCHAEDRLHRPGQRKNVYIYYVVGVHSSFEERHFNRLRDSFRNGRETTKSNVNNSLEQGGVSNASPSLDFSLFSPFANTDEEINGSTVVGKRKENQNRSLDNSFRAWFTVSRHTGRIHIGFTKPDSTWNSSCSLESPVTSDSNSLKFFWYTSMTSEEASSCIRFRNVPYWRKLDEFLTSFWSLSPYQRRAFLQLGKRHRRCEDNQEKLPHSSLWWSANSLLWDKTPCAMERKTNRYSRKDNFLTSRSKHGWSCWYALVPRTPSTKKFIYYLHPLAYDLFNFLPTCLNCGVVLSERRFPIRNDVSQVRTASVVHTECPSNFYPGAIVKVQNDVFLFCSGPCREDFFVKKSSASLRHVVRNVDDGICNSCHIDCEKLRLEILSVSLAPTSSEVAKISSSCTRSSILDQRRRVVEQRHPLLMQFPHLVERLIRQPLPGNLWHADHIIPVSHGGGECTIDNIQTLCVGCHQLKTQEDMKRLKKERVSKSKCCSDSHSFQLPFGKSSRKEILNLSRDALGWRDENKECILTTRRAVHRAYPFLEVQNSVFQDLQTKVSFREKRRINSFSR